MTEKFFFSPTDPALAAPLAPLRGTIPPAPDWFRWALSQQPERSFVGVDSAQIETLVWGSSHNAGLLLLHGNSAHADWWSFVAPFLATQYRVVAFSFSGAGSSGRRDRYSVQMFAQEAMAVAKSTGLFHNTEKPILIGHSFGGLPVLYSAAHHGSLIRAAILIDTVLAPGLKHGDRKILRGRPNRLYRSVEEALARFRFSPPRPCENLYIADFLARKSIRREAREGEGIGWSWRFDPHIFNEVDFSVGSEWLASMGCPLALFWGEQSQLFTKAAAQAIFALAPANSPKIAIPAAGHHVMVDQPLSLVAGLRSLLATWPTVAKPRQ